MVERVAKMAKHRPGRVPPRSSQIVRLLGQEAGKLRYLSPASRPTDMTFGRFFNSTFVSIDRRFVYVKNDKAGSSFIIRSLTRSEKRLRLIRHRTPFLNRQVNPLLTPAELTPRQWQRALARYFVFTFSRNPFSRTLSCYLDRIVGRDESYFVLQKKIGFADGFRPSFAEFLEMLGEDGVLDLDTHWKPQYRNIATDYFNYGFIGHFENFGVEFPALLQWLYRRKAKLGEVRQGTSATNQLADYYDDRTTGLVRDLYSRDFELFGYDDAAPLDMNPIRANAMDFVLEPRGLGGRVARSSDKGHARWPARDGSKTGDTT